MSKRVLHSNGSSWALTRAEDYVITAAINSVDRFVPPQDHKWGSMKMYYFDRGAMLSDLDLLNLNNHLRRKSLPQVRLSEGHSDSYSVVNGEEKAQARQAIQEHLAGLSDADRTVLLKAKLREIDLQPARDPVADAYKLERKAADGAAGLTTQRLPALATSRPVVVRRTLTLPSHQPTPSATPAAPEMGASVTNAGAGLNKTEVALAALAQENAKLKADSEALQLENAKLKAEAGMLAQEKAKLKKLVVQLAEAA